MSLKRSLAFQYRMLSQAVLSVELPLWFTNIRTRFFLFGLLIIMSIMYLVQISAIGVKGYEIQQWEKKIKDLSAENKKLSIEIADSGSMINIQKRLSEVTMVPALHIKYVVRKGDSLMAKK